MNEMSFRIDNDYKGWQVNINSKLRYTKNWNRL